MAATWNRYLMEERSYRRSTLVWWKQTCKYNICIGDIANIENKYFSYRSGVPNELSFPFLEKLQLKKILYLAPDEVSQQL